ncbi:protein [Lentinula edodes]|uniref:Protein n=1 Tax=Lentinula edodes TaxID=5353 RepID=A0A1Q3DVR8_LENED|nr:protein [Lentinula edodes]
MRNRVHTVHLFVSSQKKQAAVSYRQTLIRLFCSVASICIPLQLPHSGFNHLLGKPKYAHMAPSNPKSLNDDRVRTWTVSDSSTHEFALTMREIPGGVVTGALFNLARALAKSRPELLTNTSDLEIRLGLVGFSGSFCLPSPAKDSEVKLLWIAGGIGFTPFLRMLKALKADNSGCRWDIHMERSPTVGAMDVPLPSTRELELEMLLREKEGQVIQLSDEVSRLRLYLSTQPPPSTTEPVTLPPTFASLILPHISHLPQTSDAAEISNNTTTAALTQRVRVLQDENDELYGILKRGETGRLKEEVQSLKRIVHKLEGALRG